MRSIFRIPIYLIYVLYFNLLFEISINIYKSSSNRSIAQITPNIDYYDEYNTNNEYNKLIETMINNNYNEIDSTPISNDFSRHSITRKPKRIKNRRKGNMSEYKYNQLRRCQLNIINWFQILSDYIYFSFNSCFFPKIFHSVYFDSFMLSLKVLNCNLEFCNYKLRKIKSNEDFIPLKSLSLNINIEDSTLISFPFQKGEFIHLLKETRVEIKNKVSSLKLIKTRISKHLNYRYCSECLYNNNINTLLNIISNLLRIYEIMESNSKLSYYK
ncbi:uncharacterized protein CMU_002170 [Cryptosporidium muris RN66]|uniref:Uncharacterized protein n=1 Tax=Cryptosporidium muris (strain RN66) TaxID=441375 RepID=B6AGK5_CRYMR|nr:uncharacterized protein CMU_002170 [Cryptosporidium muris RN66]EEA07346.1 hypothetical protein CMU_002170 [Cryptosporidium muris RN66]|eukprot:XP_002141695.1 hypothetical protein [Cryptosporidium muris RN66]